jgi:large subunit ribosomal protein L17
MRHQKTINHLGRTSSHRKAMLSNMASSLILHKRINTTLAKAKALRSFVEPLITKAKEDSTHSRRIAFSYLQNKEAVTELFREISKKIMERPGGYTRILKTGRRAGDNADMCLIELVDYNEGLLVKKGETKAKTTRRGRKVSKAKETEDEAPKAVKEEKEEKKAKKASKKQEEPTASAAESKPEEPLETTES